MDADGLYGLPLDRFVPERGALVRVLRGEGQREEAAEVAGRRKPSVGAWAVNQLVRTQADAADELFEAGDALRDAQAALLSGRGDGRALRAAAERERAAVERLIEAGRGLLTSQGHELSAAAVDRVADTLHAAALDEDARAQVRAGCLERELRHVGLGDGLAAPPAPPAPSKGRRPERGGGSPAAPDPDPGRPAGRRAATDTAAARRAERERAAEERAEAERRERERAAAREAARAAETAARRRAQRADRAVEVAEQRRERAAEALGVAEEALTSARAEASAAAEAHRAARTELDGL